jgi:thiosulfate/3-mercaptopyruvate sulfurtransferase
VDLPIVVDATWLHDHRAEVVLADVRWYLDGRDARSAYDAGHLPGAVFVDLPGDLSRPSDDPTEGRHPLPSPEAFAATLGRLGIGIDTTVVAYDDTGGMTAGRLVIMLRALGTPAAVLDGGISGWPGPLSTEPVEAAGVPVAPRPWPDRLLLSADDLHTSADRVLLDARAPERFRGEPNPIDERFGHIPGARSAPWGSFLDGGRFRSPADLRDRFAELGITGDTNVIASCGSGVSACLDLIALEHAGFTPGSLFVPSWSGWAADPDRPAAT